MTFLIVILSVALLALVVFVLSAPVRAARRTVGHALTDAGQQPEVDGDRDASDSTAEGEDLEAAREAKYREIRDSELDYRTGKLSRADYEAIDSGLRAEAIEILNRLDELGPTDEELGADGLGADGEVGGETSQPAQEESAVGEAPEPDDDDDPPGEADLRPMAGKLRPRDA